MAILWRVNKLEIETVLREVCTQVLSVRPNDFFLLLLAYDLENAGRGGRQKVTKTAG